MSDLTVSQKMDASAARARLEAAEKHHFDKAQPFYPGYFSASFRGDGCHWDIAAPRVPGRATAWREANPEGSTTEKDGEIERAFRIRGTPREIVVFDERWNPHMRNREPLKFRSLSAAMLWISEELMQRPAPKADHQ